MRAEQDRGSSDPLPYTQVDRAVKPKAAMVANRIGVSNQHAMGSLIEFWDLNGDPRTIEGLISEGKGEVVLSRKVVSMRWRLASGHDLDPDELATIGILEALGEDQFRVRGMSRYFQPVRSRLQAREKGRAGGLASAAARKAKNGTAQPAASLLSGSASGSASGSSPASGQLRASFGAASEVVEPTRNPLQPADSGHRTADSGQLLETTPPPIGVALVAPTTPRDTWLADDFWRWAQSVRVAGGYVPEKPPRNLDTWWSSLMMTLNGDVDRACAAFEQFGQDPHWEVRNFPFAAFQSQWEKFAPRAEVD